MGPAALEACIPCLSPRGRRLGRTPELVLRHVKLTNVGPAPSVELLLRPRLNILEADHGVGRSFLLDIAWWALTRRWPAQVNPGLSAGLPARPCASGKASISVEMATAKGARRHEYVYDRRSEEWTGAGGPVSPALVLYAMADGSVAAWDPARNSWPDDGAPSLRGRTPSYVFTAEELWNGLQGPRGPQTNGLVRDWAGWQKEKGEAFLRLGRVLEALSPCPEDALRPGGLTRVSLDDPRDVPTLEGPFGSPVPVLHASAGVRRILALAYLLVWSWEEHLRACDLLGQEPTAEIVLLVDEVEAHLPPRWQRRIVPALLSVVDALEPDRRGVPSAPRAQVGMQLLVTTQSPLVLASLEPCLDMDRDARLGFDLRSARSLESGPLLEEASLGRSGVSVPRQSTLAGAGSVHADAGDGHGRLPTYQALPDELRRILAECMCSLLDAFLEEVGARPLDFSFADTVMSIIVPPRYSDRYDREFAKKLLVAFMAATDRVCNNEPPRSVIEEMCIWTIFDEAAARVRDEEDCEALPAGDMSGKLEEFRDVFIENTDFKSLWDADFEGSKHVGDVRPANLRFDEWFLPFRPEHPVPPYLESRP